MTNPDFSRTPEELKERDQWLLWDASNDSPRRPHWRGDFSVSWSSPDEWHSFDEAVEAAEERESWGIGYVMALDNDDHPRGLYGCLDIDGGLREAFSEKPKEWVPSIEEFIDEDAYIEYSPSGTGLHIPFVGHEPPEWWSDCQIDEHEGVDVLTNKFCTFTGNVIRQSGEDVMERDPTSFLFDAYKAINGESPTLKPDNEEGEYTDYSGDEYLEESDIEEALGHLDPDMAYPEWRNVGFAVHDFDSGSRGKSLFDSWSRGGTKYDNQTERYIDAIWESASPGSGVTIGTLIHKARNNGWTMPKPGGFSSGQTASTDGGSVAADSAGSSEGGTTSPTTGTLDWDRIRALYQDDDVAPNTARYNAAEKLMEAIPFANREADDILFAYNDGAGAYEENGESVVRQEARQGLGGMFGRQETNELAEHIRAARTFHIDEFGGPDWHVNLENGVLKIDPDGDVELLDHSPEFLFLNSAGTEYDPEAECPTWQAYLDDVVTKETDRMKLQEFAGYTLMHWDVPYHKSLFLVGPQASGKSTFADTIREMLGGEENVSSQSPQQMTERFGTAELFGRWANIRNDIPAKTLSDVGVFKEIIAGDAIKGERKGKDLFMFKPNAKHLFAGNTLPDAEIDDGAFYRRVMLVPFPTTIPEEERDEDLRAKLDEELPGILNWAIEGLLRLLGQGKFTGQQSPHEVGETWDKWGNTVDRFYSVCLNVDVDADPMPKKEAYETYQQFCSRENFPAETQRKFTRRLKTEHGVQDDKKRINGRQTRVFSNLEYTSRGEGYASPDDDDGHEPAAGAGLNDF